MNRKLLRAARRAFASTTAADIGDVLGAIALIATLAAGVWIAAGLGLVDAGYTIVEVAR